MDASTRPPQKRHRANLHLAACLVAVYFGVIPRAQAAISPQTDPLPASKPLIIAPTAHDICITTVKSGQEGLELSARFSEAGTERVRDIDWHIRNHFGAEVFHGVAATISAVLPPDDYQVEAHYGTAEIVQAVSVHEGTKLSVSFILNAGGLRILPRVKGVALTQAVSHSLIYAADGPLAGHLITTSYTPGEIIKLSAGRYRIESRYDAGNAMAITEVNIKAGVMSAVEILLGN